MPAKYVRPYSKGQKNDFRDAEAIAEAMQRPTMKFVATKTADQLDLQALHRVRKRLVSQRTGTINQIRAFLLERGIAVRQGTQGQRFLRAELPRILATPPDVLSPRMVGADPASCCTPPGCLNARMRVFWIACGELVLKLRHGLQFILAGVIHRVIWIPTLTGAGCGGCRGGSCGTGGGLRGGVSSGSSCRRIRRRGRC
jgi:Transposase